MGVCGSGVNFTGVSVSYSSGDPHPAPSFVNPTPHELPDALPAPGLPWAVTADSGQRGTHPAGFSTAPNPRLNFKPRFGVPQRTVVTQPSRGDHRVTLTLSRDGAGGALFKLVTLNCLNPRTCRILLLKTKRGGCRDKGH